MKKLSLLLIVMMSFVRIGFGQEAQVAAEDKAIGNVPKCFCCSEKIYKMPKPSIKGTDKICKDSKNIFNTNDCDGAKINWSLYPASISFSGQGTSQIVLDYASIPSGTPFVVITLEFTCGSKSVKNILKVPVCTVPVKLVIKEGEDAMIHQLASQQSRNFANFESNAITNWTYDGTPAVTYSLIKFNLPAGLTANDIITAKLVLTEHVAQNNGGRSLQYGATVNQSTAFEVKRVTSPWSASNVNWTNQPGTTGAVTVIAYPTGGTNTDIAESPGSSGSVDVTQFVKAMLAPNTNNGFMLRWTDNNTNLNYRSRWFGSFDGPANKRPVLIIN
jgi:hypothetical protein